ncbi:Na+/H+ antiporter subunit E [uncultured Umboniibacter sp.]|uniref:Na+/H+ antiporter subunit E n=1 Tax=uncultured Umboniibacter sp. TaxID=1798917 RepID=UPI0026189B33|nr:Na+/H+ antiporter subunit E [uncultured Umboniibacter sp.]
MYITRWTVLLSVFWLLLSGYIQPLLLSFGAVSVLVVLYVLKRMNDVDQTQQPLGTGLPLIRYLPWLFGQIVSSSIHVTKLIWGSAEKVSPSFALIDAKDVPNNCHALYANSITLTPGTLSVDLVDGVVSVHALQKSSIETIKQGEMQRKIAGIWGEKK